MIPIKVTLLLCLFVISLACVQKDPGSWKSTYRDISFQSKSPWSILPTVDTKQKTLTGVIDYKDGKSYIIHATEDVPQNQLTNRQYLEGVKRTMLGANMKNLLLMEDSLLFHGYRAYRQTYLLYTDKWGLLKQSNYIIRTGLEFVSIQISYPTTETNYQKAKIPDELKNFDNTVKVNPM